MSYRETRYFVRAGGGQQSGPYPWYMLRTKLRTKELVATDRIREEEAERWFPLADLVAQRDPEEMRRSREEVLDAIAVAKRRGNVHLATGVGCLGVGIVLTVATGGFILFWGLILVGIVEVGRGINLRRT